MVKAKKMAVVADEDTAIGFSIVGIEPYAIRDTVHGMEVVEEIYGNGEKRDQYIILFVDEAVVQENRERINELRKKYLYPILTVIPSKAGTTGESRELIQGMIERAVGFNIENILEK